MMRLSNWYFLFFIPLVVILFLMKNKKAAIKFSSVKLLQNGGLKKTIKHKIGRTLILTGIIMLIIALARPQLPENAAPITQNGIDIAMVMDVSETMESVDIEPNRFEAARDTIKNFVSQRPIDRVSLIVFAGTAYTRIPLTLDHNIFVESLQQVTTKSINEQGTAIGTAISVGLNRLKTSETKSKIMILVTDGDNNAGEINPGTASDLAKELGIKIYTIGVGTDKTLVPVQDIFGGTQVQQVQGGGLNEELLKQIAEKTGGHYYRAKDSKALTDIFSTINQLEKTDFQQDNFRQYIELAFILIKIALVLLLIGVFLDKYYFVQVP